MGYRIAAICENGHCIDSFLSRANPSEKFCHICGAEVIVKCPECETLIRGKYDSPNLLDLTPFSVPSYCCACGAPFPWTKSAIAAAEELIEEEEEMDASQREKLIASLPDIISETPKTQVAVLRFKKALLSAGKFTAEGLRQFVIDFGCELAKKQLGL